MGIEPTQPAWKAGALPLSYTRNGRMGRHVSVTRLFLLGLLSSRSLLLSCSLCRCVVRGAVNRDAGLRTLMVGEVGFEPT